MAGSSIGMCCKTLLQTMCAKTRLKQFIVSYFNPLQKKKKNDFDATQNLKFRCMQMWMPLFLINVKILTCVCAKPATACLMILTYEWHAL